MKYRQADDIFTLEYFTNSILHQRGYYYHNQTKDNKAEVALWISRIEEKNLHFRRKLLRKSPLVRYKF